MKRAINLTLASLLAVTCGLPVFAQTNPSESQIPDANKIENLPGAARPGGDPLQLLQQESVQKELGLSKEQVAEIKTINQQANSSLQGSRSTKPADLQNHVNQIRERVAQVLNTKQLDRLRGILLQVNGFTPEAPSRSRATNRQDPLGISTAQQEKLTGVRQAANTSLLTNANAAARVRGASPEAVCMAKREKNTPVLQQTQARSIQALNAEQQAQIEKRQGEDLALVDPPCPSN